MTRIRHRCALTPHTSLAKLPGMDSEPLIDVTIPGSARDPRDPLDAPPGVRIHHVPYLHPDDVTVVDGLPVTSPSRTLIDLAEITSVDELRGCFRRARALGLLDPEALRASRSRVEWRPSLAVVDALIEEFTD